MLTMPCTRNSFSKVSSRNAYQNVKGKRFISTPLFIWVYMCIVCIYVSLPQVEMGNLQASNSDVTIATRCTVELAPSPPPRNGETHEGTDQCETCTLRAAEIGLLVICESRNHTSAPANVCIKTHCHHFPYSHMRTLSLQRNSRKRPL